MADVKYQVFVSSTFVDLEDERRSAFEAILNFGHIPVGMELFQAGNDDQWSYIKRRIDSCDYYLVIVAERYGSIGDDGKSYTQMEYEYAIEKNIPVAAFLLESNARKQWPNNKVESERKSEIEKFRTICQARIAKFWMNKDDLATRIAFTLKELTILHPRTGWVRADSLPNPQLLNNYDRLVQDNQNLRDQISLLESQKNDENIGQELSKITIGFIISELLSENYNITQHFPEKLNNFSLAKFIVLNKSFFMNPMYNQEFYDKWIEIFEKNRNINSANLSEIILRMRGYLIFYRLIVVEYHPKGAAMLTLTAIGKNLLKSLMSRTYMGDEI